MDGAEITLKEREPAVPGGGYRKSRHRDRGNC
jgi:hypothetical protein